MYGKIFLVALAVALIMPHAVAQDIRILYLNKSEGFEHSVVAVKDGKPSLSETILSKLAAENGATIKSTKDANQINADNLKNYDMVIFYTQGDLTKASKDGGAPIGPNGVTDLLDWIKKGGRYMGFHSASDTFHTPKDAPEITPYLKMVGAEFVVHGPQFIGVLKNVDPTHPAMKSYPPEWKVKEEWYTFKDYNKASMHVLAILDPSLDFSTMSAGMKKSMEIYSHGPYPMIWCSKYGDGKVYFDGMGHREEIWEDPLFQKGIVDAARWLMDDNTPAAEVEPNFDKAMASVKPKEAPKK